MTKQGQLSERDFNRLIIAITEGKPQACTVIQELFDHFSRLGDAEGGANTLAKVIFLDWRGDQLWKIYKECQCDMKLFRGYADKSFDDLQNNSEPAQE